MIKVFLGLLLLITFSFSRESIDISDKKNIIISGIKFSIKKKNNIFILAMNIDKNKLVFNPNIQSDNEKVFQILIDIYGYLFQEYNFKNDIGLRLIANDKNYDNIVLILKKSYLKKIFNRTYNKDTYTNIINEIFIPPLFPMRRLFNEAQIYTFVNNKMNYSKDETNKFRIYIKEHMFKDYYVEEKIEEVYYEFIKLKKDIAQYVANNDITSVKKYIKYKLDINKRYKNNTLLEEATGHNYYDIVKLLIDNGANPNIHKDGFENAYLSAERQGYTKIAKLLKPLSKMTTRPKVVTLNYSSHDLKQMCLGISSRNAISCNMAINQDLKNTCKGIVENSITCHSIQNSDLKNLCLAKSEGQNSCYNIQDEDLKNTCLGITKFPYKCYDIQDHNKKAMCLGISKDKHHCYDMH